MTGEYPHVLTDNNAKIFLQSLVYMGFGVSLRKGLKFPTQSLDF